MDYKNIIDTFFKNKSDYVIEKLKEYKIQSRTFEYAIDQIRSNLSNERFNSIIGKNNDVFNNAIYDFNHFEDLYQKGASIALVIENEIKTEYSGKISIKKIVDKNNDEILNYSFNTLVNDLIEYDSLGKIEYRLSFNSELYKLFYESNIYDQFTLESFDGHVVNSKLYRNLFSILNPNIPIPVAVKKIDEYQNVYYDIIIDAPELNELGNKDTPKVKTKKQEFELNEQLLILNLCLEDSNSIPLTEKIKLIILIGEIKEDSIFKESSAKNLTYHKISNGIWRKGSKYKMIENIDSILIKIEKYDLGITNQTLKIHKAKLISEQK